MKKTALLAVAALMLVLACAPPAVADDAELMAALRGGGHIGLMRHSTAPGSDDPPNFRIGDCSTQRNLSSGGRAQATAIGERLRRAGITNARLVSSQWCRCLDTARLLGIGDVEELWYLNSHINYWDQAAEMTRNLRSWILQQDLSRPTILVTHQINISALLRSYPEEGEIVVVQRASGGDLRVVGTIAAP